MRKLVKKKKGKSTEADLLRIADFIVLNTTIFHEVLSTQWTEVNSLRSLTGTLQTELLHEWEHIAKDINYKPIFQLGIEVLKSLPTSPQTEAMLTDLRTMVLNIVASGIQLRHDLIGRIYHKLLLKTMGGYYATYYTSIPAAVLISDLMIKTENPEWDFSDLNWLKSLRIIDPACGSGTLLASTYAAIRDRVILEYQPTIDELSDIHKVMMEDGLHGFDVLDYAAHLTLTTLAMQNPRARFKGSKIRTLKNGVDTSGSVYLGSIDYLNPQARLPVKIWAASPTDEEENDSFETNLPPEAFHCVVMNPPFSRSANPNLKFGYASEDVRKKMGERLKKLTTELHLEGIGVAGLGSHFLVLGDKLLAPHGRIGVVIPRHILSGVSWEKIRNIFTEKYSVEYIVSNFDPTPVTGDHGWCWSENTDLGEVLIIARKRDSEELTGDCLYVNVTRRPKNEVESLLLGQTIRDDRKKLTGPVTEDRWKELTPMGELSGYVYRVKNADMHRNWHYACLFSHPEIVKVCLQLSENRSLTPLEPHLSSKGRDIAMIKRNFQQSTGTTSFPILWGHQKTMQTMRLDPNFMGYGTPRRGFASTKLHTDFSSSLLIAERPHVNTESLLALEVAQPVLATAFWEVKLKDERLRPLILLWLNSTYGFLLALGAGANSEGCIFKIKQDHIDDILIPQATKNLLNACESEYASRKSESFHSFPEEFRLAADGKGVRLAIDHFFSREFGLLSLSANLYRLLSTEPALTLKPRRGIIPTPTLPISQPQTKS